LIGELFDDAQLGAAGAFQIAGGLRDFDCAIE
jgi:hypothetical protein